MTSTAHSLEDRIRRMTPVAAPPEQQAQVAALTRAIEGMVQARKRRASKCQLVGPNGEAISIPESVFYVLERVAEVMARGDSITVVPVVKEVTAQQAADLVNVSRQDLVRLLDEGRLQWPGHRCTFRFERPERGDPQPDLGNVTCRAQAGDADAAASGS